MSDAERPREYARHLEFLGYVCEWQADGWLYAAHPVRWNIFVRPLDEAVRFFCSIQLGLLSEAKRIASLEFINSINQRALLTRFTLEYDAASSSYYLRGRTLLHGRYRRTTFGAWMDTWHSDLELIRGGPWSGTEEDEVEDVDGDEAATSSRVN